MDPVAARWSDGLVFNPCMDLSMLIPVRKGSAHKLNLGCCQATCLATLCTCEVGVGRRIASCQFLKRLSLSVSLSSRNLNYMAQRADAS